MQVHDFNLDIRPFSGGLFWTNFVPRHSVHVDDDDDFGDGGSMHVENLAVFDYGSVVNSLMDGPAVDATVSYSLRWASDGTPLTIDGANFHFRGRQTDATATWSASRAGFSFVSNVTTKVNFALIGAERNGVFHAEEDD